MKTIVSGIQPSGDLTLGNYLGAIKNFVAMQNSLKDEAHFFIFIADLHALTVPQDPETLKMNIRSLLAIYLACGLDPEKVNLFIQSEVSAHAELGYLLQTVTYMGELERMTQFKDKKQKQIAGVSSALFTYPVLMAADILLYQADAVPVGEDQKQHLELSRDIAERFNNRFGNTFKIPEPLILKAGGKIMSLQEPLKKMSKSDKNNKSSIYLLDDPKLIRKKIMAAVTDSEGSVRFDLENKPGISNLLTILSCLSAKTITELTKDYFDKGYGAFKNDVAASVINSLEPIQARYRALINSPILDQILTKGKEQATLFANRTLQKVFKKMGIKRI